MILDRVTITGADDSTRHRDLIELSEEFPFVEWGILLSATQEGAPRFPSGPWLLDLLPFARANDRLRLSLHVCGRWTRQVLAGASPVWERYPGLWDAAPRVQLNFHGEPHEYNPAGFLAELRRWPEKQFIFQMDGTPNHRVFSFARAPGVNAAPLFDVSGGAGKTPDSWPLATFTVQPVAGEPVLAYHGYAGGLGPETLPEQLPKIVAAAGDSRIWIDMEGRVRSAVGDFLWPGDTLDMVKVRRVLEFCDGLVRGGLHAGTGE